MENKVSLGKLALVELVFLLGLACACGNDSPKDLVLDHNAAFEHAIRYASERLHCRKIGDVLIEPGGAGYQVRLVELPEPEQQTYTFHMEVNGTTGAVLNPRRVSTESSPDDAASSLPVGTLVGASRALRAALNAVAGYAHFDGRGKLSVEFREGDYVVTLPLVSKRQAGVLAADYAYEIWVDGETAEIVKILTSS